MPSFGKKQKIGLLSVAGFLVPALVAIYGINMDSAPEMNMEEKIDQLLFHQGIMQEKILQIEKDVTQNTEQLVIDTGKFEQFNLLLCKSHSDECEVIG